MEPSNNLVTVCLKSGRFIQLGGGYIPMTDYRIDFEDESVPAPGTVALLGCGLAGGIRRAAVEGQRLVTIRHGHDTLAYRHRALEPTTRRSTGAWGPPWVGR
jgi:hypothetical protein